MPIERDSESTAFEARPWGGQQRLVPLASRFARGTDAPQPLPAVAAPAPATAQPRGPVAAPTCDDDHAFRSRPTAESLPMARVSNPIEPSALPSLTPAPGTLPAPSTSLPTVAMRAVEIPTAVHPAQPAFRPVVRYPAVAIPVAPLEMPIPAIAVSAAGRAPRAIAAYSVKHGCALSGFVVPHMPRVAEVFRDEDATIAIRRRPLTARSIVAIPIGAVLATVAILIVYLAHPAQATTSSSMSAAALGPAPRVMTMTIAELPAPAPAQVAAAPVVEPTVPVIEEIAVPVIDVIAPAEIAEPRAEAPKSRHRSRAAKHRKPHRKPHRIVAVDASTPLGNLRPSRY